MKLRLDEILWALPHSWNHETRGNEAHTGTHPAAGQCTVSSLLIQRHCGGNIIRCSVGGQGRTGITHYFNELGSAIWVDSTAKQFHSQAPRRKFKRNPDPNTYIFKDTWDRVDLLEWRVREQLESYGAGFNGSFNV